MREGLDGARIYAASGGGKKCLLTSPFIGLSYAATNGYNVILQESTSAAEYPRFRGFILKSIWRLRLS
jgi:hypothetical protein